MASVTYSVIFAVMIFEIILFSALVFPIPTKWKRGLFKALNGSRMMKSFVNFMWFIYGMAALLFIDSTLKVLKYRKMAEASISDVDAKVYSSLTISKIYEQRNMYLAGITLLLRFVISSAFSTTKKTISAQIELENIGKKKSLEAVSEQTKYSNADSEIKRLKAQIAESEEKLLNLKKRQVDYINLKKQAENSYNVLMELSEKHQALLKSLGMLNESKKNT